MLPTKLEGRPRAARRRHTLDGAAIAYAVAIGIFIVCGVRAAPTAWAEASSPAPVTIVVEEGRTTEEITRLIGTLRQRGLPVELRIAEPRAPNQLQTGAVHAEPTADWSLANFPTIFVEGLARSAERVAAVPKLAVDAAQWLGAAREREGLLSALSRLVVTIGMALAAARLVHGAARRLIHGSPQAPSAALRPRLRFAAVRACGDLLAVAALYAVGSIAAGTVLAGYATAHDAAIVLLRGLTLFGLYLTFARFLLQPSAAGGRLLPIEHPDRNLTLFLTYGAFGVTVLWTTVLTSAIASDRASALGWLYLCGTLINAYKVWWFWTIRHDIARLILKSSDDPPGVFARVMAQALPAAGIALPIVLWGVLTIAAVSTLGTQLATAAAVTQILFVVVPILAAGTAALVTDVLAPADEHDALGAATQAAMGALAGAGVVIAGLLVLKSAWDFALDMQSPQAAAALQATITAGIVLLAGWVLLKSLGAFFDAHAPKAGIMMPGEDDKEPAPQTRIATALPLIRNFAVGAVSAVVLLVALSRLGVNIMPILAGAGIIGLAISFGSQALVRDIVSGIFFMADDAFRVGEYIDTGRQKGSVERLTLRSLQLRHQNGQIHTIPYGQLASITNFSRDWTTMKFNIRLDRSTDIDKVRKIVKRVGQELLTDPEIGSDFLLPTKMQGVTDIAENALVVRIKFTVKPVRPTYVHRLVLRKIYAALTSEGVQFATNAVVVLGPAGTTNAAAAAGASAAVKPALQPGAG